jgi:hypothetical protein
LIGAAAPFAALVADREIAIGLIGGTALGIALLALQWRSEYRRRTYDPTWVTKFNDDFNSERLCLLRAIAAMELRAQRDGANVEPEAVDDVLDFFEDVGFYLKGDQLTPEVAHHAFHYWIRGYYNAARSYIDDWQKAHPTSWDHVRYLFDSTLDVEKERAKAIARDFLNAEDIDAFIDEERNVAK